MKRRKRIVRPRLAKKPHPRADFELAVAQQKQIELAEAFLLEQDGAGALAICERVLATEPLPDQLAIWTMTVAAEASILLGDGVSAVRYVEGASTLDKAGEWEAGHNELRAAIEEIQ